MIIKQASMHLMDEREYNEVLRKMRHILLKEPGTRKRSEKETVFLADNLKHLKYFKESKINLEML